MPATAPESLPPQPHVASRCAPDFDACWSRVTITSAEIAPGPVTHCARAVIQLGGLTPADVRVELMPVESSAADVAPAPAHRMFSSCAYDNGSFVFEASLPAADAAKMHDGTIHVHPREGMARAPVTFRIRPPA